MPGNDELPQNGGVPLINFQDYMKQERDLREEADKKLYDARVEADERAQADNSMKRVPPCDGATPQGVRDWLKEKPTHNAILKLYGLHRGPIDYRHPSPRHRVFSTNTGQ